MDKINLRGKYNIELSFIDVCNKRVIVNVYENDKYGVPLRDEIFNDFILFDNDKFSKLVYLLNLRKNDFVRFFKVHNNIVTISF